MRREHLAAASLAFGAVAPIVYGLLLAHGELGGASDFGGIDPDHVPYYTRCLVAGFVGATATAVAAVFFTRATDVGRERAAGLTRVAGVVGAIAATLLAALFP